jgi:hypothetical protein
MRQSGRREFLQLAGAGGIVFASGLAGARQPGRPGSSSSDDFFFVQLSDSHWGFQGPPNPQADVALPKAIQLVNALPRQPDFVVFTGDLTQTTDDDRVRRQRMREFSRILGGLKVTNRRLMAGEHDASLDGGKAYQEFFGALHYSFDHRGIHFVVLDNVSDPAGALGDAQIDWLHADLKRFPRDAPIVILTHRPLFDLYPSWDWTTADGAKAIDLLLRWKNVTVFYGHIHQEHHHRTEHIAHHAAKSLIFPLPPPGSRPKREPLPWDPTHPLRGLGVRAVTPDADRDEYSLDEKPLNGEA